MKRFSLALFTIVFLILGFTTGCEKKPIGAVEKMHWDRDMCERCKMAISERKYAVQIINPKNAHTYKFDDIGCAVLWMEEEKIPWKSKAIIWITDAKTGKWIDARKAFYDTNNITPMAYGFVAHKSKDEIAKGEEIIDFNEVARRVKKIGR